MENLEFYDKLRSVPREAIKTIGAGRLKGMSDINPMWRIKAMTEAFGPCGFGWKYEITKQWQESYGQEIKAFCNIDLYVKVDGEWSAPIPGTGGSAYAAIESKGVYVSDECYKMALTDALSVAMKSLGVAADIYFSRDRDLETKYAQQQSIAEKKVQAQPKVEAPYKEMAIKAIDEAKTTEELVSIFNKYQSLQSDKEFIGALTAKKNLIKNGTTKA